MTTVLAILNAAVNSLWQALAVTALVWLALRFAPRGTSSNNAATRHAIWWATLGVVLVLPVAPRLIQMIRPHPHPAVVVQAMAPKTATPPVTTEPFIVTVTPGRTARWPLAIFAVWAAILLWRMFQIVRSYVYLRGVKRRAIVSPVPLPAIPRRVDLLISPDIVSPMAVGFLRPAVVLPESLLIELSEPERDHVLLHESAHLAKYDDWTNLAMRIMGGVLALHPVAVWILRRIEREREMACDDWVVARTGSARPYAASLARLVELRQARRGEMLASGMFGSGSNIGDRIEMLLRRGRTFSPRASAGGIIASAAVLSGLMLAGSLAPRWIAFAQQPARLTFEVASVKVSKSNTAAPAVQMTPGRLDVEDLTLRGLILVAYKVRDFQLSNGPGWINSERYDIAAKTDGANGADAMLMMLQAMLEDRFRLRFHRETKEGAVYELTIAKNGSKMPESGCIPFDPNNLPKQAALSDQERGKQCGGISRGSGVLDGNGMSLEDTHGPAFQSLAGQLSLVLDRPVINRTGLTGRFNVHLRWDGDATDESQNGTTSTALPAGDQSGPSVFTAIQEQLGLKLTPAKGPVQFLVIDNVEKPDAN